MSLKKILIIEDNPKHLNEVKDLIDGRVRAGADINAHFVSTFEAALKALDTEQYDGIISDIFFPEREGAPAEPTTRAPRLDEYEQLKWAEGVSGIKLVREARARHIPFILCTSTYHHGEKTQPVTIWLRKNDVNYIVDASYKVGEGEAEHKDWQSAFIELAYVRNAIDHNLLEINESGNIDEHDRLYELYKKDRSKYDEIIPYASFAAAANAAYEVKYGKRKGSLHTMDPILMEVLDGPGRGLVPHTSEEPTAAELLERAKEQPSFLNNAFAGLGVRAWNDEEQRECTEIEIEQRTHQAVERFIIRWREERPKVELAWREWSKLNKVDIESNKTEPPMGKLK